MPWATKARLELGSPKPVWGQSVDGERYGYQYRIGAAPGKSVIDNLQLDKRVQIGLDVDLEKSSGRYPCPHEGGARAKPRLHRCQREPSFPALSSVPSLVWWKLKLVCRTFGSSFPGCTEGVWCAVEASNRLYQDEVGQIQSFAMQQKAPLLLGVPLLLLSRDDWETFDPSFFWQHRTASKRRMIPGARLDSGPPIFSGRCPYLLHRTLHDAQKAPTNKHLEWSSPELLRCRRLRWSMPSK